MSDQKLIIKNTISALRLSVYDGVFANIFLNLTGSVFLPAYALALGASSVQIGILASVPLFANIAQFGGSYLVEKFNRRKHVAVQSALLARSLWIPIVIFSLILAKDRPDTLLAIVLVIIIGYHLISSVSGVAWLSWMSLLVPDNIRGRYFGFRNSILGAANIAFTLLAGRFLDWYSQAHPDSSGLHSFEILFSFAILCSFLSLVFLFRQPETLVFPTQESNYKKLYRIPLRQKNFRRLLRFAAIWSFAVNMAAPFFIVYMLKILKLNYTTVAALTVTAAAADLAGMWIWGHISDKIGNRPVMILAAMVASVLPILWIFTSANGYATYILLICLQLSAGFFWAGYNLCAVNLVFRMAPRDGNSTYFAYWSSVNGVAAGVGAILGGISAKHFRSIFANLSVSDGIEFKVIFLLSGLIRISSLFILKRIQEPQSVPFIKTMRILRHVRSWATFLGFQPALSFSMPATESRTESNLYWPIWRKHGLKSKSDSKKHDLMNSSIRMPDRQSMQ